MLDNKLAASTRKKVRIERIQFHVECIHACQLDARAWMSDGVAR